MSWGYKKIVYIIWALLLFNQIQKSQAALEKTGTVTPGITNTTIDIGELEIITPRAPPILKI